MEEAQKPFVSLELPIGTRYVVKTADTLEERIQAFRLRYRSFFSRLNTTPVHDALDLNTFDVGADHLIVKEGADVIGTYRLRCTKFVDTFFSETEFVLDDFLSQEGIFVELSRACIDSTRRQGAVILALWRGVVEYFQRVEATYLFGCTSVYTDSPRRAAALYTYLKDQGWLLDGWDIRPTPEFLIPNFLSLGCVREVVSDIMPSLLASYIKMGARVYGEPAYDPHMECMDFFSVLEINQFKEKYARKLSE